jgi:hypothetical protein
MDFGLFPIPSENFWASDKEFFGQRKAAAGS